MSHTEFFLVTISQTRHRKDRLHALVIVSFPEDATGTMPSVTIITVAVTPSLCPGQSFWKEENSLPTFPINHPQGSPRTPQWKPFSGVSRKDTKIAHKAES